MSDEPITDMDDVEAACWSRAHTAGLETLFRAMLEAATRRTADPKHTAEMIATMIETAATYADVQLVEIRKRRPAPVAKTETTDPSVALEPTAARERAAIVAFLRSIGDVGCSWYTAAGALRACSNTIERGDHHKRGGEGES